MFRRIIDSIFSRENLLALLLALIVIALLVFTADTTPEWIYQGF
jgi:lipopolysaccharide/colanic/teichoic acid biosynthesis glycosyltransferase